MNNAVFGKTIKNVEKIDLKLQKKRRSYCQNQVIALQSFSQKRYYQQK